MSLGKGTRLGPYEIISSIGAGGMGEVFRARDTRLNRDVAVKVLPAAVAGDEDRLRRFRVEAQSAGSLNHPNILSIHDVGSHNGQPYLVTELLEGETLRQRLQGGKLSVQKAVDYARQAASGLAAAHARGITHRDVKPDNLFITSEGRVKILDFGLAKIRETSATARPGQAGDATPTETQALTTPGVVLGTVSYMSPEQVRGEPADHRSDIFSLGCVLYEMLSGRRAFNGDTSVETMNAILKEEPPEFTTIDGALPPALERIVRHCLEKSPDERFQSARDLAFDLESVSQASGRAVAAPPKSRTRLRIAWVVAAALAAIGLGAGYWLGARAGAKSSPEFQRLTFRRGVIPLARFAPDGHSVVYGAGWEGAPTTAYSVRLDSPEFHPTVAAEAVPVSVSSSGELAILLKPRVVAFTTIGTLARVPFSGGAPREVLERVQWAEWAPNGDLAIVRDGEKGNQIEYPVGKILFRTAGIATHLRFSPEGDRIAFIHHPQANNDGGEVVVVDLNGRSKVLTRKWGSAWGLAWMPKTGEIWFTASIGGSKRELRAVTAGGKLRTILAQTGNLTLEDISRDGRILINAHHEQMRMRYIGPDGERDLSWLDWTLATDLSRDGKAVTFFESGEGAGVTVVAYYRKTDGSPAVKLGNINSPKLSPDGTSVLGVTEDDAGIAILPIGAGESRRIPLSGFLVGLADWTPGARSILFAGNEAGHGLRLYSLDLNGGKPKALTPEGITPGFKISPSGKYAAVVNVKRQVMLVPLSGGESVVCPGIEPGERPYAWSSDEKYLHVMRRGSLPAKLIQVDWKTGERRLWKEIAPPDPAGVNDISGITIVQDGRYYVYSYRQQLSELHMVKGLI